MKAYPPSRRLIIQLSFLALLFAVMLNLQPILDRVALYTFKPTAEVQNIIGELNLTPSAKALFYRTEPQLNDKAAFNTNCQTPQEDLELGCYYRNKVYVLKISNPSLQPEMVTVAAHELLHAVWARMSESERRQLSVELRQVYDRIEDPELRERMASYARTEPGEELNELHSILPTEYEELTPLLEAHYAKFFQARLEIVKFHQAYETVFAERKAQLDADLATIKALKSQLESVNAQLTSLRRAGRVEAYNALIPLQNNLVEQINALIESYRAGVDEYNGLSKSLDSSEIKNPL